MLYLATILLAYFSEGDIVLNLTLVFGGPITIQIWKSIMSFLGEEAGRRRRLQNKQREEAAWEEAFEAKVTLTNKIRPQVLLNQERQRSWEALQNREAAKAERRRIYHDGVATSKAKAREIQLEREAAKAERRRAHEAREAANKWRKEEARTAYEARKGQHDA